MKILTKAKIGEIRAEGFSQGEKIGYAEAERKVRLRMERERAQETLRKFNEAPVIIESITLKSEPEYTIEHSFFGEVRHESTPATYTVKFRSKRSGVTSTMTVTFDTPDFSMADVRRKITEEFCGVSCK
ncbi:hypothetical protein [Bacillus sp. FSL K6-3431]|uniref:hypothetical protein n=1 Tax=Bacillus sp. FSL K6-3431 TaxID=2921500 RepID=UPI0030F7FB3B